MKIISTSHLNERQIKDIRILEATCQAHDRTTLTFPIEDGSLSYLLYDEDSLLSAFSAFFSENGTCLCSAFTHPAARRQGCFTLLLEEVLKRAEEYDLLFLADASCPDTCAALNALEAELIDREHMMELKLTAPEHSLSSAQQFCPAVSLYPPVCYREEDMRCTVTQNGIEAGAFHLIFQNDSAYFYGFEIHEPLRNQGIGTQAMTVLIHELSQTPEAQSGRLNRITLQVSGSNMAALALYQKLGFTITETLSTYLY